MSLTPAQIPGMIESIEQDLLLDLARHVDLASGDIVCEFGSYLGRSARCLAEGLLGNRRLELSSRSTPALHAFDVFACSEQGPLAEHLLRDARRAGIEGLLRIQSGRIDFSGVFDHYMRDLPSGLVERHQTTLASARHPGGAIAVLHIDAPKWYSEYRQLLQEFGPHLKPGAHVVLQDYFYHWSAELVAAVQLYIDDGRFEPLETAATSLLVRVSSPIDREALAVLDRGLSAQATDALIERAIGFFSSFEVDRPDVFVSRLYLAAVQHCHAAGDPGQGRQWLARLQKYSLGTVPKQIAADLAELKRYGYSLRALYEQDIGAAAP